MKGKLKLNAYSDDPVLENRFRWFLLLSNVILLFLLVIFWLPLRDAATTYPLVSYTFANRALYFFMRFVTILGSEGFFLILFSLFYWSYDKNLGFRGLVLMPLAIFLTSEVPKDIIRLPRPDIRGVAVPTYTFPSGHTSGAVSVWGYLAVKSRRRHFWHWALVIVLLVALSRVMLGYHYPGDVLGGIVTGSAFLFFFVLLGSFTRVYDLVIKAPSRLLIPAALVIMALLAYIPATFAPNFMGYIAGALTGHIMDNERLRYSCSGSFGQHLTRGVIGILGLAVIILGLGSLVPAGYKLFIFIVYTFSAFWVTYLAPALYQKIGLSPGKSPDLQE